MLLITIPHVKTQRDVAHSKTKIRSFLPFTGMMIA